MNLTDLTDVLRERAELDDTAHDARMAGIRGRIVATRRRLALASVVCVVLAVVSAVFLTVPREVEPAKPPRSLPEYASGAKLVAQAWADLPTDSVTLEYTPTSAEFVLFERCDAEPTDQDLVLVLTINGRPITAGGCHSGSLPVDDLTTYDGAVGKPLVITMTVGVGRVQGEIPEKVEDVRPPDEPVTAEFAIGVGELMPVSEYPIPPRPETLEDIDNLLSLEPDVDVRADRNDPEARQEISMAWPGTGTLGVHAAINTPGRLEVLINGQVVYELESWDYSGKYGIAILGEADGLNFSPGQTVTVTVIPERATGDWSVQLSEYEYK
jgi:hypothetical protein